MMKIDVIRKIDCYVGPFICRGLLFLRGLWKLGHRQVESRKKEVENILVIKYFGIGSILLASPALRLLKTKYPSAKVTILTLSVNRRLCEILPSIDDVISMDMYSIFNFGINFVKGIRNIRKRDFDIVIDLEFLTNFSALTTLLATIFLKENTKIGFCSPLAWRNSIYDRTVAFSHHTHIMRIFLKVAHALGVEVNELCIEPEKAALLKSANKDYLARLIQSNVSFKQCDFFVAININAGELSFHRRWPKEYFAKLIGELVKRPKTAVIIVGSKADMGYVLEVEKLLPESSRIVNLCGKTHLEEMIGLFHSCNLLVTNDSGPLHFADVIGLDTISFFGPETPFLYGPVYGEHHVLYEEMYCSPCLNIYNSKSTGCKDNICLKAINPEKVIKIVMDNYIQGRGS